MKGRLAGLRAELEALQAAEAVGASKADPPLSRQLAGAVLAPKLADVLCGQRATWAGGGRLAERALHVRTVRTVRTVRMVPSPTACVTLAAQVDEVADAKVDDQAEDEEAEAEEAEEEDGSRERPTVEAADGGGGGAARTAVEAALVSDKPR
jgi:hypothetical protein